MAPIPVNIADHVGRTPMVRLQRLLPEDSLAQVMSREREGLLRLYGAQVQVTESMGGMNEAVAAARALARDSDVWLPDQFSNPANPLAHYTGTGPEIWEAMEGEVDCLVAGVGTGGARPRARRL